MIAIAAPAAPEGAPLPPPSLESRHDFHYSRAQTVGNAILGASGLPVIMIANDLDRRNLSKKSPTGVKRSQFVENSFMAEPDGDTRLKSNVRKRGTDEPRRFGPHLSQRVPFRGFASTSDTLLHENKEVARRSKDPVNATLYRALGVRYNAGDDSFTYASEQHLIENLADVKAKTGHAPDIKTINMSHFRGFDSVEALSEGKVPISGTPEMRLHDLIEHVPFWVALPKETFEAISQNAKTLMDKYIETGSPESQDAIANYANTFEVINEYFVENADNWAGTKALALLLNPSLVYTLGKGDPFPKESSLRKLPPEERATLDVHAKLLKERLATLKELYPPERAKK